MNWKKYLSKIKTGWTLENELQRLMLSTDLSGITVPKDIQEHLDLQLPLLERQFMGIKKLLLEKVEPTERVRLQERRAN